MPHCVIEYSSNLEQTNNISLLVQSIHEVLVNSELFDIGSIKVRATPFSFYLIGESIIPFIHSTVRLLAGRTDQQKKVLSQKILETIFKKFVTVENITVDILDINPNTYGKKQNCY